MRVPSTVVLAACLSLLAACGGAADDAADGGGGGVDDAVEEPTPTEPGAELPGTELPGDEPDGDVREAPQGAVSLEDATAAVVDDLATSEGVAPNDVEVVAAERVIWPDGALGCPEPGSMYTQALAPGYRIVLRVSGDEVTGDEVIYTGGEGAVPTRCDDPVEPVQDAT